MPIDNTSWTPFLYEDEEPVRISDEAFLQLRREYPGKPDSDGVPEEVVDEGC